LPRPPWRERSSRSTTFFSGRNISWFWTGTILGADNKLVRLEGDEIGRLVAQAVQDGVTKKRPWYEPSEKLPDEPVITSSRQPDFETLVVEQPAERIPAKPRAAVG
jgi:hypothetical protein